MQFHKKVNCRWHFPLVCRSCQESTTTSWNGRSASRSPSSWSTSALTQKSARMWRRAWFPTPSGSTSWNPPRTAREWASVTPSSSHTKPSKTTGLLWRTIRYSSKSKWINQTTSSFRDRWEDFESNVKPTNIRAMRLKLGNFRYMFMLNTEVESGATSDTANIPLFKSASQSQESDFKI